MQNDVGQLCSIMNAHNTQQTRNILYDICTILDQRRRRRADVLQLLCTSFVFAWKDDLKSLVSYPRVIDSDKVCHNDLIN